MSLHNRMLVAFDIKERDLYNKSVIDQIFDIVLVCYREGRHGLNQQEVVLLLLHRTGNILISYPFI